MAASSRVIRTFRDILDLLKRLSCQISQSEDFELFQGLE